MDAGGLAQMHSNFTSPNELGQMPSSGLASRRGGQSLKPLSLATPSGGQDNGAPTPRTSRSHLLAGLRTAPKSATTSFPNSSQALPSPTAQGFASSRNTSYGSNQSAYNSAPKTAMPQFVQQQVSQAQQQQQQALQQQQQQQLQQQQQQQLQQQQQQQLQLQQQQALQQQQQQQQYNSMNNQHFTMEQVLAPPEIRVEDQDQMDPQMYAQLVATNLYLAQQQRALQQELYNLQAAAQQFQGLNLGATQQQIQQQQIAMYQQQQRVQTMQQSMLGMMGQQQHQQQQQQQQVYAYVDPMTGQTKYYVDPNAAQQSYVEQQIAQMYGLQQQPQHTPRVQVSPPAEGHLSMPFRTNSPPKRNESPIDVAPLPPPSANAFRRGHKKIASLAMPKLKESLALSNDAPKSAGPRTSSFPMTPLTGYMPGGGRAGEHPVRQPKGPPSIDELKAKPTTKHEGSKNFSFRARRSAVHNLVRAGRERRKGTGSSSGSMSPVSESAEESSTPITDNESDSGRSGSGSLSGEVDCPIAVPRAPTSGTWGAIGSDRPSSRQKTRKSLDSISSATSGCESDKDSSFAGVFKSTAQKAGVEIADGQRKAPMMVLTSAEKRRASPVSMA